jgi:hypothetical protein
VQKCKQLDLLNYCEHVAKFPADFPDNGLLWAFHWRSSKLAPHAWREACGGFRARPVDNFFLDTNSVAQKFDIVGAAGVFICYGLLRQDFCQ